MAQGLGGEMKKDKMLTISEVDKMFDDAAEKLAKAREAQIERERRAGVIPITKRQRMGQAFGAVEKRKFKCMNCTTDLEAVSPKHEVLNGIYASIVILSHPDPVVCKCGAMYVFKLTKLAGVEGGWSLAEQQKQTTAKSNPAIIEPPKRKKEDDIQGQTA